MMRLSLICPVLAFIVAIQLAMPMAAGQLSGVAGEATPLQPRDADSLPPQLKKALDNWEDFIHYHRIANLELANSAGTAFANLELTPEQLLTVVEDLSTYQDYETTLIRAEKLGGAAGELARKVLDMIHDARLEVARESQRIREAIEQLDDGLRSRINAQARLKRAGEYAAPQLLAVLLSKDDVDRQLRPYVIESMVSLGRPMVAPLCEAMDELPPVAKQQAAEILSRIGYPLALPYLKHELSRDDLQEDTRRVLRVAYNRIVERTGLPPDTKADRLFLMLAEDYYNSREDLIMQPDAESNLYWQYSSGSGLSFLSIPTPVFPDVMAMRASRRALRINGDLSAAMSLWLAANFRRQNNLPDGSEDPSYGEKMRSPIFYAELAGPRHVHPVLQRALQDQDAELALDAIAVLNATAGTYSLLNVHGNLQPVIAAMNYPDRRVRFESAFAIARSMPRTDFSGAQRVVPVLSEAIREQAKPYAVAIGPDTDALNATTALIKEADGEYRTLIGNAVDVAAKQIASAPGIDLVVIRQSIDQALATIANARRLPKLQGVPVVLLADANEVVSLNRMVGDQPMVFVTDRTQDKAKVIEALTQAAASNEGAALSDEQAQGYATAALDILKTLELADGKIFDATDAQPAIIEALNDPREPVVLAAGDVLALFTAPEAQQALADAALSGERQTSQQVELLKSLAHSARNNGNQIDQVQLRKLMELVETSTGPLADAAAEAHGALNLPTSNAVDFVTSQQ